MAGSSLFHRPPWTLVSQPSVDGGGEARDQNLPCEGNLPRPVPRVLEVNAGRGPLGVNARPGHKAFTCIAVFSPEAGRVVYFEHLPLAFGGRLNVMSFNWVARALRYGPSG